MSNLITKNGQALRMLMTEDLYILTEEDSAILPHTEKAIELPEERTAALLEKIPGPAESPEFFYQGENNKYFLILFNNSQHKEMSMLHKETLLKIMSAKGMELRDLAIMNFNQFPGVGFNELKDFFSFNKLVLFGIDPQQIALPAISLNQIEKHAEAKILCTFNIEEMINDTNKKREFWNVMKNF